MRITNHWSGRGRATALGEFGTRGPPAPLSSVVGLEHDMADDPKIPLCRSEWLQDASIELGRRFAVRHPFRSFTVEADTCDHNGEQFERLTVWASTHCGTLVNLTLWDDRTIWVAVTLRAAENNSEY